jgi:hypothetical protein
MTLTNLTKEDRDILYFSLSCRKCIIETGEYEMSAQDAVNCGKAYMVRALTSDQMAVILKIEELMKCILDMGD